MKCTNPKCGCEYDDVQEGFYLSADGAVIQPCKVCQCDNASMYYYNNHEIVLERRRKAYGDERREYMRKYMQQRRANAVAC